MKKKVNYYYFRFGADRVINKNDFGFFAGTDKEFKKVMKAIGATIVAEEPNPDYDTKREFPTVIRTQIYCRRYDYDFGRKNIEKLREIFRALGDMLEEKRVWKEYNSSYQSLKEGLYNDLNIVVSQEPQRGMYTPYYYDDLSDFNVERFWGYAAYMGRIYPKDKTTDNL